MATSAGGSPELVELSRDECLALLSIHRVGRVALCEPDYPVVLPVNYRLVTLGTAVWLVLRTSPGSPIDHVGSPVALQIDGIDPHRRVGWSVLVRGHLELLAPDVVIELGSTIDPQPWIPHDRERWLVIRPELITGRELHEAEWEWAFAVGYL